MMRPRPGVAQPAPSTPAPAAAVSGAGDRALPLMDVAIKAATVAPASTPTMGAANTSKAATAPGALTPRLPARLTWLFDINHTAPKPTAPPTAAPIAPPMAASTDSSALAPLGTPPTSAVTSKAARELGRREGVTHRHSHVHWPTTVVTVATRHRGQPASARASAMTARNLWTTRSRATRASPSGMMRSAQRFDGSTKARCMGRTVR
jgi:hypothetical protein